MTELRNARRILAFAFTLVLGWQITASAHFDPPAPPAMKEHIELLSVHVEDNGEWTGAAKVQIETTVIQEKHPNDKETHRYGLYMVKDNETITINQPIYRHEECNPVEEQIEVSIDIKNTSAWIWGEKIAKLTFNAPVKADFKQTVRSEGHASATYRIKVSQDTALDQNCSPQHGMRPSAPGPRLALLPPHAYANPGATASFRVTVENRGPTANEYRLAVEPIEGLSAIARAVASGAQSDTTARLPGDHLAWFSWPEGGSPQFGLAPGQSRQAVLRVAVPGAAAPGEYGFKVVARGKSGQVEDEFGTVEVVRGMLPSVTPIYAPPEQARAGRRWQIVLIAAALLVLVAWLLRPRRRRGHG